jgi:hypothetical protein
LERRITDDLQRTRLGEDRKKIPPHVARRVTITVRVVLNGTSRLTHHFETGQQISRSLI